LKSRLKNRIDKKPLLFIFCCIMTMQIQGAELTDLEGQIEKLAGEIDSVKAEGFEILREAGIVAQKIHIIQSRSELSRQQHQGLEKQLQQAQSLERKLYSIEMKIDTLYHMYLINGQDLLELYRKETDRLLDQMEHTEDPDRKSNLLHQFQTLMGKRNRLDDILHPLRLNSYRPLTVESQPWDTSDDMKLKGDMLMDRSEVLQNEASQIERKIASLAQEYTARKKAEEISEELDFYDWGEVSITADAQSNYEDSRNVLGDGEWDAETFAPQETESGYQAEPWNPIRDDLSFLDVESGPSGALNSKSIEEIIQQLKRRAGILRIQSDSLQSRAHWFYKRAE